MKTFLKKAPKYLLEALILAGCAYILKPGFEQYIEHRNEIKRLETEIKELESERVRLETQMHALEEENPEYIERLAREKLHLSKPDETIFRFKKKQ
ncbi:MAG: septum formation initiator family protein [Candidatus Lindowbacteria bacterium]|nr:septum formation initiator family protein [Candidatus Lindowbacteria bacterium]